MNKLYTTLLVTLLLIGILLAFLDPLLFKIYLFAAPTFSVIALLLLKLRKSLAKQAIKQTMRMATRQSISPSVSPLEDEEDDEPSITVQYDSHGPRGVQYGFGADSPDQPGGGRFNPTEVARDTIGLEKARQIAAIMNSGQSETSVTKALNILELDVNNQIKQHSSRRKKTVRNKTRARPDHNPYGIAEEGNYSIE